MNQKRYIKSNCHVEPKNVSLGVFQLAHVKRIGKATYDDL